MYERSAPYYDLLNSHLDYGAATDNLLRLISAYRPRAASLLDVACGTGRYLEQIRVRRPAIRLSGLDLSLEFLEQARCRVPGIPLHEGNMVNFELNERFDVVTCLFCSIGFAITPENMFSAVASMARHLNPGGLMVIEPWVTPEACYTYRVTADLVGDSKLKVARLHAHEKRGRASMFRINYLVGTPSSVEHFVEEEILGLFTQEEYLDAVQATGLSGHWLDSELFPGHPYGVIVAVGC